MEPVKLNPAFKDYLWGGTKLKTEFGKKSDLDIVAESWELSTHKDGQSVVASGKDKGVTLSEYIEKYGNKILGRNSAAFEYFPILIKLIDAKDNLSIQVHPNDEYALKNEGEYGKTEMWYILDAEDEAFLYYGLKENISKDEFKQRIENNTLLDVLNKVSVHKGDTFFISAGTVHAIGRGIIICEIQQNSNTTYRVYDYDRRDARGNPRQLHIEKALDVSDLFPPPALRRKETNQFDGYSIKNLAECKYFTVDKICVSSSATLSVTSDSFIALNVVDGEGSLSMNGADLELQKGDCIFIPAQDANYTVSGKLDIICSYL
ncbi:MAG: class I mannose-6-phosphate isomerase [Clostridia bacterium]|nr:class I mannose-6-phosphate isomerase [Clostridia bacterium]